jgi:DNA-binding beta-propeller fold protein YncE
VTRIDASTLAASQFSSRPHPLFLTADDKVVYVSNASDGTVSTLDARTGSPTGPPIRVGQEPLAIVTGGGSMWVANRDSGTVSRISGRRVVGELKVGGRPVGLLYRDGVLWVADVGTDSVIRVDTGSGRMTRIRVGLKPYALGFFDGAVWVTNRTDGTVWRLDPATGARIGDPIAVPGDPVSMTSDDSGNVWVASHATGRLTRIEP